MKVTLDTILDSVAYTAKPGIEYEVAPGRCVTMKIPVNSLLDTYNAAYVKAKAEFDEALKNDPESVNDIDYQMAVLVTDGEWPERGELIPLVVSRVHEDFFSFRLPRLKPQEEYWKQYSQLATRTREVEEAGSTLRSGIQPEED